MSISIGIRADHHPYRDAERNRCQGSIGGLARKFWGAIIGIHRKKREPRKNSEMDWVKLPCVTPFTVVKIV